MAGCSWPDSGLTLVGDIVTQKPKWIEANGTPQDVVPSTPNQFLMLDDRSRKAWGLGFPMFVDGGG